jgi:hypothetical protein
MAETAINIVLWALAGVGAFCLLGLAVLYAAFRLLKAAVHRWEREQTKLNERMDAIIREHAGEMEKPN